MKKTFAALLTGLILSAPVAAQTIETISFGVDGGYPPFDVLAPSGEITGFDMNAVSWKPLWLTACAPDKCFG